MHILGECCSRTRNIKNINGKQLVSNHSLIYFLFAFMYLSTVLFIITHFSCVLSLLVCVFIVVFFCCSFENVLSLGRRVSFLVFLSQSSAKCCYSSTMSKEVTKQNKMLIEMMAIKTSWFCINLSNSNG